MKLLKSSGIYFKRYLLNYLVVAIAFAVMSFGFGKLLKDSLKQYQMINFFSTFPYDMIVPKGNALESLLFIENIRDNNLTDYIPSNLYTTLKENPALELTPLLKQETKGNTVTVATDITEPEFSQRLGFLQKYGAEIKTVSLEQSYKLDSLWGKAIVNVILVKGPLAARAELKDLVQKKTVAEYVSTEEKVVQIMKLMGWTATSLLVNWFIFAAVFVAITVSMVISLKPLWSEISTVLGRWNHKPQDIILPVVLPAVVIYAAVLLMLLMTVF